ncbi:MAG: hypothetical protein HOH08_07340, partial [Gammaproteobacteria bacterium]|nr:hypothetical protein [Gammaproteobacteria bacterium]
MFKNFLTQLTKVTDFFIIIATVFVVLAFLTPAEVSIQPSINIAELSLKKAINDRSQINSKLDSLREEEVLLNKEFMTLINQPTMAIDTVTGEATEIIIDTSTVEAQITQIKQQIDTSVMKLQTLNNDVIKSEQEIEALELKAQSSKSISWLQPIRKNTMILINAGG